MQRQSIRRIAPSALIAATAMTGGIFASAAQAATQPASAPYYDSYAAQALPGYPASGLRGAGYAGPQSAPGAPLYNVVPASSYSAQGLQVPQSSYPIEGYAASLQAYPGNAPAPAPQPPLPADTYGAQSYAPQGYAPQGYAQPGYFPQGYGQPGYAQPGYGYEFPGAVAGFPQFPGFGGYGFGTAPYAPAEPTYAPFEAQSSAKPSTVTRSETAEVPAKPAMDAARSATFEPAPRNTARTSSYSVTLPDLEQGVYVGSSRDFVASPAGASTVEPTADPYARLQQLGTPAVQAPAAQAYERFDPSYGGYVSLGNLGEGAMPSAPAMPAPVMPAPAMPAPVAQAPAPVMPTYEPMANYGVPSAPVPQGYQALAPQPVPTAPSFEPAQAYEPVQAYDPAPSFQQAPQAYEQVGTYGAPAVEPAPAPQQVVTRGGYEFETSAPQPAWGQQPAQAAWPQERVVPVQGTHVVQVAAFRAVNRAEKLANKLRDSGVTAFVVEAQVKGKRWFRVRVGASDKRHARVVRDRIRELGYYEARILKV